MAALYAFLFLSSCYCALGSSSISKFTVAHQWYHINFTWPSEEAYKIAIDSKTYIPVNVAMTAIKIYKDRIYVGLPRLLGGVPATLGYFSASTKESSPLITPFPSWEENTQTDCDKIQSVQSLEIDTQGMMWVLDGCRITKYANRCPPKLILLDLNDGGRRVHTHVFSQEISLTQGGFLNDLVLDDSDGGFAYITDNSPIDPGLIVYSKEEDRAWKLRDASMFAEKDATGFVVNGAKVDDLWPIDGVALSPPSKNKSRRVFYSAVASFSLYSIETKILKDEKRCQGYQWRSEVRFEGRKKAQGDGMMMDSNGNLYYGLLPLYGVGRWNTNRPLSEAEVVEIDKEVMFWPDCFAFDEQGYLYLLADNVYPYFNREVPLRKPKEKTHFRLFKYHAHANSYQH